jgi:hypothetical protein
MDAAAAAPEPDTGWDDPALCSHACTV